MLPRLALIYLCLFASSSFAATFTITTGADSGPGTLRQAILDANSSLSSDEILVQTDVSLLSPLPIITSLIDIDGLISPGVRAVIDSPSADGAVFTFSTGSTASSLQNIEVEGLTRSVVIETGVGNVAITGSHLHQQVVSSGIGILIGGTTAAEGNQIGELQITGGTFALVRRNTVPTILVTGGDTHRIGEEGHGNVVTGRISVVNAPDTNVEGNSVVDGAAGTIGIFVDSPSFGGGSSIAGNSVEGYDVGILTRTWSHIERNVISGNIVGIELGGGLLSNADGSVVGGSVSEANTIQGNTVAGIRVTDTRGVWILGNQIFDNGIAIDLGSDGPTPNDAAPDADSGPNDLQNYPILTSARNFPTGVIVGGGLTSQPATVYSIEFFFNPSGDPETRTFLARRQVTTDASGNVTFSFSLGSVLPTATDVVTATATAEVTPIQGSTSEVSPAVEVQQPGSLEAAVATISVDEGTTAQVVIRRLGGSEGTVTVEYTTVNFSAVAPGDYAAQSGTLTFPPGVTEQTISIVTFDDHIAEHDESFQVFLHTPEGGAIIGDADRTTIVINANGTGTTEVPTASEWALIVMTLCLATVALRRSALL
jgi:hypothetical protein